MAGGYRATMEAMGRDPRPTALIAAGNTLMAGALRALHELDLRVGTDVSFVGCDNVLIAELHQPPIAVVYRDAGALGEQGARMLLGAVGGEGGGAPNDEVVLLTMFLATPSCGRPARPTPSSQTAIWSLCVSNARSGHPHSRYAENRVA